MNKTNLPAILAKIFKDNRRLCEKRPRTVLEGGLHGALNIKRQAEDIERRKKAGLPYLCGNTISMWGKFGQGSFNLKNVKEMKLMEIDCKHACILIRQKFTETPFYVYSRDLQYLVDKWNDLNPGETTFLEISLQTMKIRKCKDRQDCDDKNYSCEYCTGFVNGVNMSDPEYQPSIQELELELDTAQEVIATQEKTIQAQEDLIELLKDEKHRLPETDLEKSYGVQPTTNLNPTTTSRFDKSWMDKMTDALNLSTRIDDMLNEMAKATRTNKNLVLKIAPNVLPRFQEISLKEDCKCLGDYFRGFPVVVDDTLPDDYVELVKVETEKLTPLKYRCKCKRDANCWCD